MPSVINSSKGELRFLTSTFSTYNCSVLEASKGIPIIPIKGICTAQCLKSPLFQMSLSAFSLCVVCLMAEVAWGNARTSPSQDEHLGPDLTQVSHCPPSDLFL